MELHGDQLADALLLHRHPVENVRNLNSALVMGDDEELALTGHLVDQLIETAHIGIVQSRIDLIEQERRAMVGPGTPRPAAPEPSWSSPRRKEASHSAGACPAASP